MPNLLLNSQSILMCPHGGRIQHVPSDFTTYRIHGFPAARLTDQYMISGCPHIMVMGNMTMPSPCVRVQWFGGSPTTLVKGSPVLTSASTGICLSATGIPQGPAIVAATQTTQLESSSSVTNEN